MAVSEPPPPVGDGAAARAPGELSFTDHRVGTTVTISWNYSDRLDSDVYRWRLQDEKRSKTITKSEVTLQDSGSPSCIVVTVVRESLLMGEEQHYCA